MAARKPAATGIPPCTDPTVMTWQPGERDLWLSWASLLGHGPEQPGWTAGRTDQQVAWLLAKGPDAAALEFIAPAPRLQYPRRAELGRVAVARFELGALPLALSEASLLPDRQGLLLLPFRGPEAALAVAGWLRRLGSGRLWARLWLGRHPEAAARALIPATTGRPTKAREQAEDALLHLAAAGHAPIVFQTAEGYGQSALTAVTALLAEPRIRPARRSPVQEWQHPDRLPPIRRPDGDTLPAGEVTALLTALSRSRLADPPEPPPGALTPPGGIPLVVESSAAAQPMVEPAAPETAELIKRCDPESLAVFGRALLDAWLTDGMPPAQAWVLLAQAHIGDDATMDELAPRIRVWAPEGRYNRAVDGHAVLATVGTDVALRHLLAIVPGMSGGPVTDRATDYLAQAAARRGLTATRLADRLTPTHGLDGTITLDYGSRTFTVAVDEHLTPQVIRADGRPLARTPKPGPRDTRPEAYTWFLNFKKELRSTATAQLARLERDMFRAGTRVAADPREFLLPHPVLGPLTRRLLWGEYDGRLVRALRIAEDGTFADVDDRTVHLDPATPLGVVHPAELGDDLPTWRQIFADYEILQPFPQVNRPAITLSAAERTATSLPGFGPIPARGVELLAFGRWERHLDEAEKLEIRYTHQLPDGLCLVMELSPGTDRSIWNHGGTQTITELWIDTTDSGHWHPERHIPFGACDPAALSEVLLELYTLRP